MNTRFNTLSLLLTDSSVESKYTDDKYNCNQKNNFVKKHRTVQETQCHFNFLLKFFNKNLFTSLHFEKSLFLFLLFGYMTHILHTSTVHKTAASLADEGNSAYCQSSGAHNIKHICNLWKLALRGHLNTDAQARARIRNFLLTRTMP